MAGQGTLRIAQHPGNAPGRYRVEIAAEISDRSLAPASVEFAFALTDQERADLRWYLEDYLEFPEHPASFIASRIEARMIELGEVLFREIFQGSDDARVVWAQLRPYLAETRIEVTTGISEATSIPWELLRDPHTKIALALAARAFVRSQRGGAATLGPAQAQAGKVRILLVICRPKGAHDVPFRSVAGRLVAALNTSARDGFDLDVLRPPTYEELARALRQAKDRGAPYHIVHFDGHGTYADPADLAKAGQVLSALKMDGGTTGRHGYLMFEDPKSPNKAKFVDGGKIGQLMAETNVPILVLNACQSAFAEAMADPNDVESGNNSQPRGYGSLAQAVIESGTPGVVAMRYSVYVVTAAQFVAELYSVLAAGQTLGEAVSRARKYLADQPARDIAYGNSRALQDWCVPIVYERAPIALWPKAAQTNDIRISIDGSGAIEGGVVDAALPARPDIGFYGRDETLYAIDRAFDRHAIVLLHALAGAGKTATASEFARWYALTGGVDGPVLFSSFERHLPLSRLLDKIGTVFVGVLEQNDIQWDAITDTGQRRDLALQILKQIPTFWIWDNIEPVTGFPAGAQSDWSAFEQSELRDFLRALRDTKAKVLLTSRRDEHDWLGDLPTRVEAPPMPMRERLELAGAIAERRGHRLADLPDLRPLLAYTGGNPLSILVMVGQALRDGIATDAALATYLEKIRAGETDFDDEEMEGRTKSLGASLSYGFTNGFTENERAILALLHLFHGFVGVDALCWIGQPDAEWCFPVLQEVTREQGIALLDRAAESGLLTALGGGYYRIHPALPWYFRTLFDASYPQATGDADRALRAFVQAMRDLGNFYHLFYQEGNRSLLSALSAEEDNLLAAWRAARQHGWWDTVIGQMQGLRTLYGETGRQAAWRRLVETVVPDFVDPANGGPWPGREEQWGLVSDYRVRLAREERRWSDAERLQQAKVVWSRQRAAPALAISTGDWSWEQRNTVRTLAIDLQEVGQILCEKDDAACTDAYLEAMDLAKRIGDQVLEENCVFNLGKAYQNISILCDYDEAVRWYRRSIDLVEPNDALSQGKTLGQIGQIAYLRFIEAHAEGRPDDEILGHLNQAADLYHQALDLFPEANVNERAVVTDMLGVIYGDAGYLGKALHYYRQSIRYEEAIGNLYGAGQSRMKVAVQLARAGRLSDALAYAEAALQNFNTFGDRAADLIQRTRDLITSIRDLQKANSQ